MIKFLLLELKDTIITKNKKIAAWRSTALKCAPPTSGLHKFADEKDVPDVDEEFLAIINDILKKQKTVPGATQFPEYADSSKGLLTNEGKAAFNDFLKKSTKL
ncbi:Protein CBG27569 [Caenorhabditis briggsae]|uniref:Protein CBG27569 n=1 Tax=Caenorhabditis briggsae TaxID=6238 RepID=B6IKN2_CAEBR|nr:Protein CBG27569 [Caenorhabditis briggsae]CAS00462.1 Protein CBG27569 [Caenorhabditis briggsae]